MNNLREIWGTRFVHYMTELQKYLKYVFTGHLAIVFVFTIGAGGYAYSEWLKDVPANFPVAYIAAILIGAALTYSPPVTLIKQADTVYFLPLEKQLESYLSRALSWTTFSQLPLPFILFIIILPLLSATETGSKIIYIWIAVFIVVFKRIFVETEYYFRHALRGRWVWLDRAIRFLLISSLLLVLLSFNPLIIVPIVLMIGIYCVYWRNVKSKKPFPYDHFIELEQNRMMAFYRFANYFTDVPHLKGSISRRAWLSFLTRPVKMESGIAQSYLIKRTFIRTDDIFWLWVRLTAIAVVGTLFIPFPIVIFIFAGALAFASAVQLIYALRSGYEFRMDMLFPEKEDTRPGAIRKIVRKVQWIQAGFVLIAALYFYGFTMTPFLLLGIILLISEITIRNTGEKKEAY
ncbi:ABC transporter permease [Sporosarcina siberiensis]|uniref:ABC transporter permease n=1 Tax=Sporosarcina siberiensis TaxID=1365606 RepID=A0ABW4SBX5_9BACL